MYVKLIASLSKVILKDDGTDYRTGRHHRAAITATGSRRLSCGVDNRMGNDWDSMG